MIRRHTRPARLIATAVTAGALLTTAACADSSSDTSGTRAETAAAAEAAARQTEGSSGTLTSEQARQALITEEDLEDDWQEVDGADDWDDDLEIGGVDVDDFLDPADDDDNCERLIDDLFDDDLLSDPTGAEAVRGFAMGDARLLNQVASYNSGRLDSSMDWLKDLPSQCDQFTVTDDDEQRTVQIVEMSLPDLGDDRQGLEITVQGDSENPSTLTFDLAVVRIGDNALTITSGSPDGGEQDSVRQGAEAGTQRLQDVLGGGDGDGDDSSSESPSGSPSGSPTESPTQSPSESPTESPTESPSESPTQSPTESPTDGG
ncbi:hypothetical protein [Streptomyces sp. HSG2]|uniref:hypothetical protein n=1 Tax=Streptomyces sp. HSG2 TaxID=2797167 RepID=UPI0032213C81